MRSVVCLLAVAAAMPTGSAYARWHFTDLGTLGGAFSRATAINDRGQVVGFSVPAGGKTGDQHCFLWDRGKMTDLGELPGTAGCEPVAIDDAGDVAGTSGPEAFVWHDGHFTDLGSGTVADMSRDGWVVGTLHEREAFVWHDGKLTLLPRPHESGWFESWPIAIAPNHDVAGDVVLARKGGTPRTLPVVWHDGTLTHLPLLPHDAEGRVAAMNDTGDIVGTSTHPIYHDHAVLWHRGHVTEIPAPESAIAEAVAGNGAVGVLWQRATLATGATASESYVWSGAVIPLHVWVDFTCANMHLLAGQRHRAFVFVNGKLTWLPAKRSAVEDVNAHDQVVGWTVVKGQFVNGTPPVHAALWSH